MVAGRSAGGGTRAHIDGLQLLAFDDASQFLVVSPGDT
jgi:hypothetical protein